uniref:Uncharacterized protein n=1 Tax=Anguilla anguilla TaxID=7936 RepID=A0A0E9PI97_ANGAN
MMPIDLKHVNPLIMRLTCIPTVYRYNWPSSHLNESIRLPASPNAACFQI